MTKILKAYTQGWKDRWKWASQQSDFSAEEDVEKKLYGDIDSDPGETKALGFQAATMLRDRSEAIRTAELKPGWRRLSQRIGKIF